VAGLSEDSVAGDDEALTGDRRRSSANGIQVINRAARILRALRDDPDGLSLGQIAARVDLPRSTVQRIVNALVAERFLMAASPSGKVRIGIEIISLAESSKIDIVQLVHPHLKALSEATGETVDLSILRNDHLYFVDQVIGSHRLRAVSGVGEIFPLHSTANGKACLALLSDAEIKARYGMTLTKACKESGGSLVSLLAELKEVRKSGIAFDQGEHTAGISAVGTALADPTGMIFAVSVPVPTHRFKQKSGHVADLLLGTRARLADAMSA
jgi:DNA-binding IclR family transcriptional regulator